LASTVMRRPQFRLAPVTVAVTSRIRQPPILSISVIRLAIGLPRFRSVECDIDRHVYIRSQQRREPVNAAAVGARFAEPAAQWEGEWATLEATPHS
jgi:hypothetical protein